MLGLERDGVDPVGSRAMPSVAGAHELASAGAARRSATG